MQIGFNGTQFDVVEILAAIALFTIYVGVVFGGLYAVNFALTLPMRRNERGRLFLDLLEMGIKDGRSPEWVIKAAAGSRDRSLGQAFYDLESVIEQGLHLSEGLQLVPKLLPVQVVAMLKAGERIGDIGKVLPACRLLLKDAVSHVRGALNYLVLLAFVVTPFTIFVPGVLRVKVLPSFRSVFEGAFAGGVSAGLPAFTRFILTQTDLFIWIEIALLAFVWLAMLIYLAGPKLRRWSKRLAPGLWDFVAWRVPWQRKRLYRDYSGILAVLLDAGVAESEAVVLAGESTANSVVLARARKVQSLLRGGTNLPDALRVMDASGEFQWRAANGLRYGRGFLAALAGWHDALDAKAFQLEQAAAQITTTVLVLINGAVVAAIVIGLFLALVSLLNQASLW
jgi:type II secretory pathway component PulF